MNQLLNRYSKHTILFRRTLEASLPALKFFVGISSIILFLVSCIIYFLERGEFKVTEEHPDGAYIRSIPGSDGEEQISPFSNVLIAFFWSVVSTTTLKQADLTVGSAAARLIAVGLAYCQVIMVALPL